MAALAVRAFSGFRLAFGYFMGATTLGAGCRGYVLDFTSPLGMAKFLAVAASGRPGDVWVDFSIGNAQLDSIRQDFTVECNLHGMQRDSIGKSGDLLVEPPRGFDVRVAVFYVPHGGGEGDVVNDTFNARFIL
jgi:hypothetical protein